MAAFTRADPSDRSAFDAHYERVRIDPSASLSAASRSGGNGARAGEGAGHGICQDEDPSTHVLRVAETTTTFWPAYA